METSRTDNALGAKVRLAFLKSKQLAEMESFRSRIYKEIDQTLEEMKRQNELKRNEAIQTQELKFIAGLVKLGQFNRQELINVVDILFSTKTVEERTNLLKDICENYSPSSTEPHLDIHKEK